MIISRILTPLKVCIAGLVLLWLGSAPARGGVPPLQLRETLILDYSFDDTLSNNQSGNGFQSTNIRNPVYTRRLPGRALKVESNAENSQFFTEISSFDLSFNHGLVISVDIRLSKDFDSTILRILGNAGSDLLLLRASYEEGFSVSPASRSNPQIEVNWGGWNNVLFVVDEDRKYRLFVNGFFYEE